jgi:hypothetical protein
MRHQSLYNKENQIQIQRIKLFFSRGSRVTALNCTVLRLRARKSNQTKISKDIKGPIIGSAILFQAISNQAIFSRGSRVTALNCTVIRLKARNRINQ